MPTQLALDGERDDVVPALAGGDGDHRSAAGGLVVGVDLGAGGRDLDDGALEAAVGDDQVAAAAEHEHRLAGGVGVDQRVGQLGLGGRPHPPLGGAAEPERGVVARAAQSWRGRRTAFGMPSTFCPSQVTVSATVVSPSSVDLRLAGDLDLDAALGGHDDRVGELAAEADDLGAGVPASTTRAGGQGHRVHAVRDHAGQPDAGGHRLVLVDRVLVAAGRGVADQVGAGDREGLRLAASCTRLPGGPGWRWSCRPGRRRRR